jgi:hypothetical protein
VIELERALVELAAELEWPPTPHVRLGALERRRRPTVRALALAVAVAVIAVAVAFAVPQARSAILRFLHLGGVTIERVRTLPPGRTASLTAGLGAPVSPVQAKLVLGEPFRLPRSASNVKLYLRDQIVSAVLDDHGAVLLSELRSEPDGVVLKKIAARATSVEPARVTRAGDALWLEGGRHLLVLPHASRRLAGHVLLWVSGGLTFRLEGASLDEGTALALARELAP